MTKVQIADAIDDYQQGNVQALVEPVAPKKVTGTPILSWMTKQGVAEDSELGQTLKSQDVERIGLLRKGKQAGYDNIPASEFADAFGITPVEDGQGYVDQGWLADMAIQENSGEATLTEDQQVEQNSYEHELEAFNEEVQRLNTDVNALINDHQIESEEGYINSMLGNTNMDTQRGNDEQTTETYTGQDERSSQIAGQTDSVSTNEAGLSETNEYAGRPEEQTVDSTTPISTDYTTKVGKPYKTKAILEKRLKKEGVTDTYDIVEKDGGFVGVVKAEEPQLDEEFNEDFDGEINFSVKSGRRFTTRMIDYLEKQAGKKEYVKRGHFDNLLAGGLKNASKRDKELVSKVMEMPEFKDAQKVSIPAFIKAMESKLLQFSTIDSDTYSTYGASNVDLDATSDNSKTVILNTDFNHGEKGHFGGDFDKTTTSADLQIRKIGAGTHEVDGQAQYVDKDKYYVTLKGLTADNLESGTYADFNTEEEAQQYIDTFANRKTEDAGMLSHYRRTVKDGTKTVVQAGDTRIDTEMLSRPDYWIHKFNRVLGNGPTLSKRQRDDEALMIKEEIANYDNRQLRKMAQAYDDGNLSITTEEDKVTHVLEYQSDVMQNIKSDRVKKSLTRSNKELRKQEEDKIVTGSKDPSWMGNADKDIQIDANTIASLKTNNLGKKNYTKIRDAVINLREKAVGGIFKEKEGDLTDDDLAKAIESLGTLELYSGMYQGESDYINRVINTVAGDLSILQKSLRAEGIDGLTEKSKEKLAGLGGNSLRAYIDHSIAKVQKAGETLDNYKFKRAELDPAVTEGGAPIDVETASNLDELVDILDGFISNQKARLKGTSKKAGEIDKRLDKKYEREGNYYRDNTTIVSDKLIEFHRTVEDGTHKQFGKHVTYQRDNNADDYQKKAINSMLREMAHASSGLLPREIELWTNKDVEPYISILEKHIEKAKAKEKLLKDRDITPAQAEEVSKSDQFLGFKQDHYKVTIQEAIKGAHRDGSKVIRFPTPMTISYIEGYVDEDNDGEGGFLTYGEQRVGDEIETHLGDGAGIMTADYGENHGYEITTAQSGVREFKLEDYIDEEVTNWHADFEYNVDVDEYRTKIFDYIASRVGYIEQNDKDKADLYATEEELDNITDVSELYQYINGKYGPVGMIVSDQMLDDYRQELEGNTTDHLDTMFEGGYHVYDYDGTDYVVIAQEYGEEVFVTNESYATGMSREDFKLSDVPNENGYQDIARKYGYDAETKTKGVFYKYLEKLRPDLREITDDNGFTWYESDITSADGSPTVLFQTKTKESLKSDATANNEDQEFTQAHRDDIKHLKLALARTFRKPVKDMQISQGRLDMSQVQRRELEALFDKRITPVKTDKVLNRFNGVVIGNRPDTIFVNEDSEQAHISVIGHEMVHEMRKDNPELFEQVVESLRSVVDNEGFNRYKNQLDANRDREGMSPLDANGVREEFVADLMADNWNSEMFWKKVAVENMSTYKKIARWVGTWIAKLLEKAGKLTRKHGMLRSKMKASQFTDDLVKTQDILAKVMRQYVKARSGDKSATDSLNNGSVKFSAKGKTQRLKFDDKKPVDVDWKGNAIEHIQNVDHYLKHYEKQLTGKNTLYEKLKTQNAGVKEMTEMLLESFEDQFSKNLKTNKLTMKDFDSYMKSKSIGDRLRMLNVIHRGNYGDTYSGWTESRAERYLNSLSPAKLKGLQAVEGWYRQVIDRNNKLRVEFGLDTQSNIDMYRKREPNYVSWKEFGDIEDAGIFYNPYSDSNSGIGRGQRQQQQALGRTSESGDVATNLLMETGNLLKNVGQLNIERGFLNMINSYESTARDYDMNPIGYKERIDPDTGLVEIVYDRGTRKDDFIVHDNTRKNKDGDPLRILVRPKTELAQRIIQQFRNERTKSLEGTPFEFISQYMRFSSAMITMYSPAFALITNPIRDFGTVMFQLPTYPEFQNMKDYKKKVTKRIPKAWKDIGRYQWSDDKTGDFALLREFGGKTGWSVISTDYQKTNKHIQARIKNITRANYNPVKGLRLFMEQVKKVNELMENGIRLAVFRTLLDEHFPQGHHIKPSELTKEERKVIDRASFIAKNVSLDFNMKGNATGWLKSYWLFVNPAIQGAERTVEALKQKRVRHALYTAFGVWTMNAMMQQILMGDADDDGENDYQNLPAYKRNTGLNFMVAEDKIVHVPLPLNLAMINTLANQVAKYTLSALDPDDEFKIKLNPAEDLVEMMGSVMYSMSPVDLISSDMPLQELAPHIAKLPIELIRNKNWFGAPIYKDEKFNKHPPPAPYNYKEGTNPWAVETAQLLHHLTGGDETHTGRTWINNIHPESLEYSFDYILGGFGSFTRRSVHLPQKLQDGTVELNDIPLVRRLLNNRHDYSLGDRFRVAVEKSFQDRNDKRGMWMKAKNYEKMVSKMWKGYGKLKEAGNDAKAKKQIEAITKKQRQFLKLYNAE